jgi:4-amino-4-deoxy-L-arabinose transferase
LWATYLNHKENNFVLKPLFLGSFLLGLFYIDLDPFFNLWDEQFHALVAKNMATDLLTPKLYNNPSLPLNYKYWTANEVWLHKQPLFLWQMALSIKVFGTTTFAVRLPSVIMHSLLPILIYKIGEVVFNHRAGFYGALIFAVSSYPLELMIGKYATDHNDIAFLFYTTASFWAWFEYQKESKWYWLILIGIFSGCAVLVKWLMGLIVFIIWGIVKLSTEKKKLLVTKSYVPIFISFVVSCILFIPWQIYSFSQFPIEAAHEFSYNSKHLFEVIEGHGGSWSFHFTEGVKKLYGDSYIILFVVIVAVILSIIKSKNKKYRVFFTSLIFIVYLFFSLVASKMVSYPIIVFPIICLFIGFLIYYLSSQLKNTPLKPVASSILLFLFCYSAFDFKALHHNHIKNRKQDELNLVGEFLELKMIETLDYHLHKEDYVLFNNSITPYGHIATMFFTLYESYSFIPSEEQIKLLKNKNIKIACLKTINLPSYVIDDKAIRLVPLPKN